MKIATIIARVLLGLIFVVFGSNVFLHFIPMPPPDPESLAGKFMIALFMSGYFYVIGALQVIGGLLVLIGRVPLGLLLLGPIIVNIALFHIFLNHSGAQPGIAVSVLSLFLLWRYRENFAGLLKA